MKHRHMYWHLVSTVSDNFLNKRAFRKAEVCGLLLIEISELALHYL